MPHNRSYDFTKSEENMSERDKLVSTRNLMFEMLNNAVDLLNEKGKRDELASLIKYIGNVYGKGFGIRVDKSREARMYGRTVSYTTDLVYVTENGSDLFVIGKRAEGHKADKWDCEVLDFYELRTDDDIRSEAKWERDAENAYEKHLDYLASFDDPRGY